MNDAFQVIFGSAETSERVDIQVSANCKVDVVALVDAHTGYQLSILDGILVGSLTIDSLHFTRLRILIRIASLRTEGRRSTLDPPQAQTATW